MNPFEILEAVQQDYLTYVRTFQRFQNPEIRDWVLEQVQSGTLLWKPPFIQISRPFAPGDALDTLVAEGLLHPATPPIFRHDPDDLASLPIQPYRHQSDAIRRILGHSPLPKLGIVSYPCLMGQRSVYTFGAKVGPSSAIGGRQCSGGSSRVGESGLAGKGAV